MKFAKLFSLLFIFLLALPSICFAGNINLLRASGEKEVRKISSNSNYLSYIPDGVVQVSAGVGHSCAISGAGKLYCWGGNGNGRLGNNTTTSTLVPALIYDSSSNSQTGLLGGETVKSVSTGETHTCAISESGKLYCWGDNEFGQLGINSIDASLIPVLIYDSSSESQTGFLGGEKVISVSSRGSVYNCYYYTCAISESGKLYCWGGNEGGVSGNNTEDSSLFPVLTYDSNTSSQSGLLGGEKVSKIFSGKGHSCAVNESGKLYCWGINFYGGLGNNSTTSSLFPVPIYDSISNSQTGLLEGKKVISASIGEGFTCAISEEEKLYCWGDNAIGQLGTGLEVDSSIPVLIYGGIVSVSSYSNYSCAVSTEGKVYCWGGNSIYSSSNKLISSNVPALIYDKSTRTETGYIDGEKVSSISTGFAHVCAINNSDKLYCWGLNRSGQ